MNSGAIKNMISHTTLFDTCEIFVICNTYLDDDSVKEAIRMDFIVGEVMVRDKIKMICMKNDLVCQHFKKIDS